MPVAMTVIASCGRSFRVSVRSRERAICGIDLADEVQELVVTDDAAVLARRGLKCTRAWQLTDALGWARQRAQAAGFDRVVVACEPTGHRWRVVAEQWGLPQLWLTSIVGRRSAGRMSRCRQPCR